MVTRMISGRGIWVQRWEENNGAIFSNKLSQPPVPAQTLNELHPQQYLPTCHPDVATHSHVSFVIVANFLDSDVILGVDEWLGGGVGLCHGYDAGYVTEVILVLNFDLDCQNFSKNMTGAKRTGIFGKWKSSPCLNHTMSVSTDRVKNRAGIAWFKEKASWDQNRPEQPLSPASCTSPGEAGIMERAWVLPRWLLLMLIAFMMLQRNNWSLKKHYFI